MYKPSPALLQMFNAGVWAVLVISCSSIVFLEVAVSFFFFCTCFCLGYCLVLVHALMVSVDTASEGCE